MGIDGIGVIIWVIIIVGGVLKNISEQKRKDAERKLRAKKRKNQPTQSLTPSEILQKQRQLKEQKHKTQASSLDDLFQQIFEKDQPVKKEDKKIHKPIKTTDTLKKQTPRTRKKATVFGSTEETNSKYTLAMDDLRRAIITKEIIDKPKALRNDYFY